MKALQDTSKFRPDQGFKGSEAGEGDGAGPSASSRNGPVQFEIAREKIGGRLRESEEKSDPFGIADLVTKKQRRE